MAASADAQPQPGPAPQNAKAAKGEAWVPPGTPGSPIDGELFHAQVLMSAHGFSPGVIDGKEGESFKLALRSFQEARGLERTGELDPATRQALLQANRPSTVMVTLGPDDVRHQYVYPLPKDPEKQAELKFLGYRNMLEKVAERYHTTPGDGRRAERTGQADRAGPDAEAAQRRPDLARLCGSAWQRRGRDERPQRCRRPAAGRLCRRRQERRRAQGLSRREPTIDEGEAGDGQLVAAFPVTMGSKQYPLPIGNWKATTYAFLPPFNYQPELLNNPKTDKEVKLPPGPNGPVGVAWLDLTKEHYGIHGTNEPQTIGRAESSGCIRMTNWDVLRLARMMKPGFTAIFQA